MTNLESGHDFDVVIVGGGHAGAQAAIALRQQNFSGSIAILTDEHDPPYERPPLSKEYLAGEKPFERILIRPAAFWPEREVALLLGQRVTRIDAQAHRVETDTGLQCGYRYLVWAAGGTPRRLSCDGSELAGIHFVRSRPDVDQLMVELGDAQAAVVIGGGYIGLEAAAVLAKLGKHVTVLEALPRVLARVAGEPLSRFYEAEHRAHGIDLRTSVTVESLVGEAGRVTGVRLADGTVLRADLVIVGIGIVPSVEPLLQAGAVGTNGVEVDEYCRTSLPGVYAVGDCALHRNAYADGAWIRIESVQNANDMATVAAKSIAGVATPYDAVPWFWSNQFDLRLQTIGLSIGHDKAIVRGSPGQRKFSIVYLRQGRVIALDCVNSVRDYVQGRALVVGRCTPDLAALGDPDKPLKELA